MSGKAFGLASKKSQHCFIGEAIDMCESYTKQDI